MVNHNKKLIKRENMILTFAGFKKTILFMLLFVGLIILTNGCSGKTEIDLSGLEPGLSIQRFDSELFSLEFDEIPSQLPRLEEQYGEFFDIFNHMIIRIGSHRSPAYPRYLQSFLGDFDIYRLQKEVDGVFADMTDIELELEDAFRHYMYYFPGYPLPKVFTYISGFNQSVVTAGNILGIGLDKYLGIDHVFYQDLQLPIYQRTRMHRSKIPSDCMIAWAMTEFEFDETSANLLENIIYEGKLLYFADKMLPHQHDSLKTGIPGAGLEWCRRNEKQMWTFLVENKLLFSTDVKTIGRFINDGPFSSEFTRESPARAAVWLGWQIVESYMNRNSHVSLHDLMTGTDYQQILAKARYRP
jgi:hypothetical protein